MPTGDALSRGQGRPETGAESAALLREQELLARVREVSQQLVEQVNKALDDTAERTSIPTEEKPPLP